MNNAYYRWMPTKKPNLGLVRGKLTQKSLKTPSLPHLAKSCDVPLATLKNGANNE